METDDGKTVVEKDVVGPEKEPARDDKPVPEMETETWKHRVEAEARNRWRASIRGISNE
jgi:hypothetical protein